MAGITCMGNQPRYGSSCITSLLFLNQLNLIPIPIMNVYHNYYIINFSICVIVEYYCRFTNMTNITWMGNQPQYGSSCITSLLFLNQLNLIPIPIINVDHSYYIINISICVIVECYCRFTNLTNITWMGKQPQYGSSCITSLLFGPAEPDPDTNHECRS